MLLSLRKNLLWLFITLLLFTALALIVVFKEDTLKVIDLRILTKMQTLFAFLPVQIPIFISDFGYKYNMVLPLTVVGAVLLKFRKWKEFLGCLLITEGVYLSVMLIKEIIQRHRPDEIYQKVIKTSFSFPSGHSSVNMFFYLAMIWLIFRYVKNRGIQIAAACIFGFWILSVGFSRVFLGVHYPSDVLGGYLVGFFAFLLFVLYTNLVCKTKVKDDDQQGQQL